MISIIDYQNLIDTKMVSEIMKQYQCLEIVCRIFISYHFVRKCNFVEIFLLYPDKCLLHVHIFAGLYQRKIYKLHIHTHAYINKILRKNFDITVKILESLCILIYCFLQ